MESKKVTLLQIIILIIIGGIFVMRLYKEVEKNTKPKIYTGALVAPGFSGTSPLRGPNGERPAMPSRVDP